MKLKSLVIITVLQCVVLNAATITLKNGSGPQGAWMIKFIDNEGNQSNAQNVPRPQQSRTYSVSDSVQQCQLYLHGATVTFPCEPNATYQLITRDGSNTRGIQYQDIVGASKVDE